MFTHCLPSLSGPDCGHFRAGHRTISLSHMPSIDHHPHGWGRMFAPLFSCQPTFGSDGKTKARSDSKVFHPSDSGKQQDKGNLEINLFRFGRRSGKYKSDKSVNLKDNPKFRQNLQLLANVKLSNFNHH